LLSVGKNGAHAVSGYDWAFVSAERAAGHPKLGYVRHQANDELSYFTLVEFLILALLSRREMSAQTLSVSLAANDDFGPMPGLGTLAPMLRKLARDQVVISRNAGGSRRNYYSLTGKGTERLLAMSRRWLTLNAAIRSLLPAMSR
jgi:DNA-binding PadR family transcriptional regulator